MICQRQISNGGAKMIDQVGQTNSVGRQTSHVVQIGFFLLEKKYGIKILRRIHTIDQII